MYMCDALNRVTHLHHCMRIEEHHGTEAAGGSHRYVGIFSSFFSCAWITYMIVADSFPLVSSPERSY